MEIRIFQKGFHFSQDGPGNRLVYHLQGCGLRCPWCANPEGLRIDGGTACTVEELAEEVQRSQMMFFDGGGVTLTGGEVTVQFPAVKLLLEKLRQLEIHTCIETNGIDLRLPQLFPVLDLLIVDLKHHDEAVHRAVTGQGNRQTVENIRLAVAVGQPMLVRIPLIGGFNASLEDAERFGVLLASLGVSEVELLPYHEFGKDKYRRLGMSYTMTEKAKVSREQVSRFVKILEAHGIHIIKT